MESPRGGVLRIAVMARAAAIVTGTAVPVRGIAPKGEKETGKNPATVTRRRGIRAVGMAAASILVAERSPGERKASPVTSGGNNASHHAGEKKTAARVGSVSLGSSKDPSVSSVDRTQRAAGGSLRNDVCRNPARAGARWTLRAQGLR